MWIQQKNKVRVFGVAMILTLMCVCGVPAFAQISASPVSLQFPSQTAGTTSAPIPVTITNTNGQNIMIESGGTSAVQFSYSGPATPFNLGPGQSFTGSVKFAPSGAQTYNATLTFKKRNGQRMLSVNVSGTGTQVATAKAALTASASAFAFSAVAGGAAPATQSLTIGENPAGALPFTVTADQAWMTVSASSGMTSSAIQVGANTSGLAAGNYTGHVIVSATGVTNSPMSETVTLAVTAAQTSPYVLVATPNALTFTGTVGSSVACQSLLQNDTTPTAPLPVAMSTDAAWLTVTPTVGKSAVTLSACVKTTGLAAGTFTGHIITTMTAPNSAGETVNNSPYSIPVTLVIGSSSGSTLAVNPASVAFGNINLGNNNTKSVTLTNSGTGSVTISQVTAVGAGLSASGIATPMVLSAGQTTVLSIVFAPTAAGSVNGTVSVVSDATNSPAVIAATGTGAQASVTASPATLNFGNVTVGSSGSQAITLSNNGSVAASISQAAVSGTGYTMSGITMPMTLAAGASSSFTVQFAPMVAGTVGGGVTVTSNTPNSPTLVGLSGTGAAAASHSVSLTWVSSTSTVVGYNIYRGSVSGGPYTVLNSTPNAGLTYTDVAVTAGQTYFYVVTAVDASGNESIVSNEVSATIPTP